MVINPQNTLISQYKFATVAPNEYKHPAIVGGFGSGKTYSIPLRTLFLIDWRARYQKIKAKIMVVEPTKEMIRDILVPTLDEYFDALKIRHTYHKTYHDYTIRFKKYNFTLMLRSSDVPESLTGKNLTDIILDEFDKKHSIQKQKEVWKECISRIRKSEFGTVSPVTTPEGYKYTFELYGECDYRDKKNFKLIRAKTYENTFLPSDYIENLYDQFSQELVQQYIEAQFINLTQGKVYYAWDRVLNNTDKVFNENLPLKVFVDFNINPMKWAICQTYGSEDFIVDELVQNNTYTEKMAVALGEKYGVNRPYIFYGDYSGTFGSTKTQTTDYNIIKGILPNTHVTTKPNPSVMDRVNAVNSRLRNSKGERKLFVNVQKCPHVVKDFEQVVWDEKSRDIDKRTNSELTHISDAIGYYIEHEYSLKGKPIIQHNFR